MKLASFMKQVADRLQMGGTLELRMYIEAVSMPLLLFMGMGI